MHETLEQTTSRIMSAIKPLSPEIKIERDQELQRRENASKTAKIEALRSEWNAPARNANFSAIFEGLWNEAFEFLKTKKGTGFMVALVGGRGNGKTQLGVELMRHVTEGLKPAMYATAMDFFMAIKRTYRPDSQEDEMAVIRRFRKPSLLVVDEIGKRGQSDWENNMLFELLNKRYGDMTDTILTDNASKAEFIATIGPSLASRMQETGGIICADWPSFRQ